MISDQDRMIIIQCAEKYRVGEVFLFGSAQQEMTEPNDIDLGVKGIDPRCFFKFYGELYRRLSKMVDLVDLTRESPFNQLVIETGIKIYG